MFKSIEIPITAVPASRPRVTRWGVYFGKNYTRFKKEAKEIIPKILKESGVTKPLTQPLEIKFVFELKKPRTSKLDFPRGDVDNYVKAIQDSLNGFLYEDDKQIIKLTAEKTWSKEDKECIQMKYKIHNL
tara:strand:- start:39 stop:428 length:390 start_codon:yes stop_codon:yes gene_type:complete